MGIERFQGCLLGLALGDALGAAHEGGALERMLWRVIGRTRSGLSRWTDDTQMSLDLAESLIAHAAAARLSARVTHAHPAAMEGAALVATATGCALLARRLGHGVAASESCVTAGYVALRFLDRAFLELHQFVAAYGGDVDTIGAMAGAIWGAANGIAPLPGTELDRLEQRERLMNVAAALHASAWEEIWRIGRSVRL